MKRTKRFIALFLVMVLALSMSLSACGKKNDSKDSASKDVTAKATEAPEKADPAAIPEEVIPKDTLTLTVYSQLANYSGEQVGWFAKIMKDKFNVKLKIVKDDDGVLTTRMESGNLGDIVCFGEVDSYATAAKNGLLFDWNQDDLLTDYGPYIKENMAKALEKNAGLTKSGKVYGLPMSVANNTEDHQTYLYHPDIRWDLYKQLGYPAVNNLDDLVKVLGDMKKICPKSDSGKETYGVSMFTDWDGDMVMQVKATAALYGYEEWGLGLYNVVDQTWQGSLQSDGMYLKMLKFYNQLYRADLVDPDSMTQGYEGANEDYQNGGAFWNLFTFLTQAAYNSDKHLGEGKAMYALPLGDQNTLVNGLNVFGNNYTFTIGATTQYPELCMAIINWLSTPEGAMITKYGPKGLTWDYDENGKTISTKLGLACRNDPKTELTGDGYSGTFEDGSNQMAIETWNIDAENPDSNGETFNYVNWASYQATQNTEIQKDWRNYWKVTTPDELLDSKKHSVAIGTSYSQEARSDELDVVWQQVIKTIKDYSWKAIYAKDDNEFNKIVAEMQKKANDYGYDKCVEFMLDQSAKRKAAEDKAK